jgi:hypothetical protein
MSTFKDDILEAAQGEPIISIVIGHGPKQLPDIFVTRPILWDVAAPLLDYEYDGGFGAEGCHPICAWTATRVLFVHEYDGSTSVISLPRDPTEINVDYY